MLLKFSANKSIYSYIIRKLTNSKYSHVDVVLEDGFYIGSQPSIGVVIHKEKCDIEDFYSIDIQLEDILPFLYKQIGKKYDYSGVIGWLFKRNWQEDDKWFCSELVAAAINSNKKVFNEEAYRITPNDILQYVNLK